MTTRKGLCKTCIYSTEAETPDKRVNLYCRHYKKWCKLVSRNCPGPETRDYSKPVKSFDEVREEYRKSLEKEKGRQ